MILINWLFSGRESSCLVFCSMVKEMIGLGYFFWNYRFRSYQQWRSEKKSTFSVQVLPKCSIWIEYGRAKGQKCHTSRDMHFKWACEIILFRVPCGFKVSLFSLEYQDCQFQILKYFIAIAEQTFEMWPARHKYKKSNWDQNIKGRWNIFVILFCRHR